jgi:hypothetical protein
VAPKYHPTPLSGGDRKALQKELVKARAMTKILAEQSEQKRRVPRQRHTIPSGLSFVLFLFTVGDGRP